MSNNKKQIQALQQASQAKRENAFLKVNTTIRIMKEKNLPINFESVAKLAGVSKTWLYRQEELKTEINSVRNKTGKIQRAIDLQSTLEKKETELLALKRKNANLKDMIKALRRQLEVVYGELYKTKSIQE